MTNRQREILTGARDEARELVKTSEQHFETQLSYIAGGGLALTFVLVEKLVGNVSDSTWPVLLYIGWFTMAACLVINFWSQKVAAEVHSANKAEMDATLMLNDDEPWHDGCYSQERCERRKVRILKWNRASIYLLFAGIAFILGYTIINLAVHKSSTLKTETKSIFENKRNKTMSDSNNMIQKPYVPDIIKAPSGSTLPIIHADPLPSPTTGQIGTNLPNITPPPAKKD